MGEQVLAQVGDDALADALQNDGLKVGAGHRENEHARIDGNAREQPRQRKITRDQLLQRADDQRRDDVIGNGKQH